MSRSSSVKVAASAIALLILAGCAQTSSAPPAPPLASTNLEAGSRLAHALRAEGRGRLLITSMAPVTDLGSTTSFGLLIGEQVGSRMAQAGFDVIEARLRSGLIVNTSGEFILSRDIRDLARGHRAAAVVTGTYAVAEENVYVTLRAVALDDNKVLAAETYTLPITADVRALLQSRSGPAPWRAGIAMVGSRPSGAAILSDGAAHVVVQESRGEGVAVSAPSGDDPVATMLSRIRSEQIGSTAWRRYCARQPLSPEEMRAIADTPGLPLDAEPRRLAGCKAFG